MKTKSNVFKAVSSAVLAVITIIALFLSNKFLNLEIGQNGSIGNFANILVFTFGIFWIFVFFTSSMRQIIYFSVGTIMVLASLLLFAHQTFNVLDFIEQSIFQTYSQTDSIVLCFSGLYLMIYTYIKA